MNFNKKIVCSVVTVLMLSACSSEDKYKAPECTDCLPDSSSISSSSSSSTSSSSSSTSSSSTSSSTSSGSGNPNPEVSINFAKNDENITWEKQDPDEITQGLALSSQNAIVYNKWDNRLMVIDINTQTISDDKLYLDVTGGRYSSGETITIDAVTGASEQILEKVLVNESGTSVFSLLEKYGESSNDIGVGIYSDSIANGIPDAGFSRRDNADSNYFNYPDIKDIALSHDGQTLIAGGDDRNIKIFSSNNLNTPDEIAVGKKIRSLNISEDDKYIFCGSGGLTSLIRIYDIASKAQLSEVATAGIPQSIVEIPDANKIIAIFVGSNKARIYDITDINTPVLEKTLIINGSAKSISISPDKKTFAITATGNQVNLFSIDGADTPKVIKLTENTNGAVFLSESKLMVTTGTEIVYYDITLSN